MPTRDEQYESTLRDLSKIVADHPPRKDRVVVSWCHSDHNAAEFTASLAGMVLYDARHGRHICGNGGGTIDLRSGPRVAEARSQICDHFLTTELFKAADWLLMLDDDMAFDADMVDKMMQVADPETVPVLGGLCFAGRPGGPQWPTVYRMYNEDDGTFGVEPVNDYPRDALVKVGATGAACMLIHRQVLVAMSNHYGKQADGRPNPYPWFQEGLSTAKGVPLGEDILFCKRAVMIGVPLHVHTGIKLGHCKTSLMTEATFDEYRRGVDNAGMIEVMTDQLEPA